MDNKFIGIFENAYSKEYCDKVIAHFENMKDAGLTVNRLRGENTPNVRKNDDSLFAHSEDSIYLNNTKQLISEFTRPFWEKYYKEYADQYSVLQSSDKHTCFSYKVQKTEIGGGYHVWHYESASREQSNRLLVWVLYLNDVDEGGETEFLYQNLRVKAKAGTLVIWPAAFTHTHRGNPPLSNTKYIVTGWLEF